jgi:hypothetical protein
MVEHSIISAFQSVNKILKRQIKCRAVLPNLYSTKEFISLSYPYENVYRPEDKEAV